MQRKNVDLSRLGKFLSLLGSDQDGEVCAAARQAHKMVTEAGMTWGEFVARMPTGGVIHREGMHAPQVMTSPAGQVFSPPVGRTWAETAAFLAQKGNSMSRRSAAAVDTIAQALAASQKPSWQYAQFLQWAFDEYIEAQQRASQAHPA